MQVIFSTEFWKQPIEICSVERTDEQLKFNFSDGHITLSDYHSQDCCEDVKVDWEEIPIQLLNELKRQKVTDFTIKAGEELGLLLIFTTTEVDDLWLEPIEKKILVSAHNIQNGYYSTNLTLYVEVKTESQDISAAIDIEDFINNIDISP